MQDVLVLLWMVAISESPLEDFPHSLQDFDFNHPFGAGFRNNHPYVGFEPAAISGFLSQNSRSIQFWLKLTYH